MEISNEQLDYIKGITAAMISMKKELVTKYVYSYQKCKIIVINNTDIHYYLVDVSIHSNGYPDNDNYCGKDRIRNDFETGEIDKQSQIEYEVFHEIQVKTPIMWVTVAAQALYWEDKHFVNTHMWTDITDNKGDILVLTVTIEGGKMKVTSHTKPMHILF
uniref:Uncharacterized protein n=1 Tax=Pithovirus LCPAC406 TaxID=2506599 RepID=A0A481ZHK4_9VIRU|nr:MAG: hypothetical protein LCPAC406_03930 [Pithovirus LCPAC406]